MTQSQGGTCLFGMRPGKLWAAFSSSSYQLVPYSHQAVQLLHLLQ